MKLLTNVSKNKDEFTVNIPVDSFKYIAFHRDEFLQRNYVVYEHAVDEHGNEVGVRTPVTFTVIKQDLYGCDITLSGKMYHLGSVQNDDTFYHLYVDKPI